MATLTMEVSMSSSTAASVTAMAMRYLYLYGSSAAAGVPSGGPERPVTALYAPPGRETVVDIAGVVEVGVCRPLLRIDVRHYGHPRAKRAILPAALGHLKPHRHSLYHLGEVAGCIVRWEQRELGAGCGAQALHPSLRRAATVRIHVDLRRLADLDVGELRFLEVRRDPHTGVRHDGQHGLAGLHELAHLHAFAGY